MFVWLNVLLIVLCIDLQLLVVLRVCGLFVVGELVAFGLGWVLVNSAGYCSCMCICRPCSLFV